ncbi:MAG: hypothetical protein HOP29_09595, partial [Phycisphaerales bacterium]|nr:hypothetical protein [Phycisphaerales bacterium]
MTGVRSRMVLGLLAWPVLWAVVGCPVADTGMEPGDEMTLPVPDDDTPPANMNDNSAPDETDDADDDLTPAESEPGEFDISVEVIGQGAVAPDGGRFAGGSGIEFLATAADGWRFDRWSGDASGTANPLTISVGGDLSITVTFIQQFQLRARVVGNGSITLDPPGGVYDAGSEVSLNATPATGWRFVRWEG